MRLFLCPVLTCIALLAPVARGADTAGDREAIESVVHSVFTARTPGDKPIASLFTADAKADLDRLARLDRGLLQSSSELWSETTKPIVVIQSIRFVTPDVALVDAADTQYGSSILLTRIPFLVLMKKEGTVWLIASFRLLPADH